MVGAGQALFGKDILNLTNTERSHPGFLASVQQRTAKGRHSEVPAAGRTLEFALAGTDEGTGNHAAHAQIAGEHLAGDAAHFVQLLAGVNVLMAGHLEHAVRRSIHDGRAGTHVLLAQFIQDDSAGGGNIADDLVADGLLVPGDKVRRKTGIGEGRKRLIQLAARQLPVTGGGVLAGAGFQAAAKGSDSIRGSRIVGAFNMSHAQLRHIRQIGLTLVDHMAPGAGAHVAILRCVRQITHAGAVQNSQKYSLHVGIPPYDCIIHHFCNIEKGNIL